MESDVICQEVAQTFEQDPALPGVTLLDAGKFYGMISCRHFHKQMSCPFGIELFLGRPIKLLYESLQEPVLILDANMSIVAAASQALDRSSKLMDDPIVVDFADSDYGLLEMHHLLLAQAQLHQLTLNLLQEQTQAQLIQTEKMASLGQIVAGIAHEILNPINFIWGNIDYLSDYSRELMALIAVYDAKTVDIFGAVQACKEEIEFDFLKEDLPW